MKTDELEPTVRSATGGYWVQWTSWRTKSYPSAREAWEAWDQGERCRVGRFPLRRVPPPAKFARPYLDPDLGWSVGVYRVHDRKEISSVHVASGDSTEGAMKLRAFQLNDGMGWTPFLIRRRGHPPAGSQITRGEGSLKTVL